MSAMVFCALCPNLMDRASAKWSDWEDGYLCAECLSLLRDEGYFEVVEPLAHVNRDIAMDEATGAALDDIIGAALRRLRRERER